MTFAGSLVPPPGESDLRRECGVRVKKCLLTLVRLERMSHLLSAPDIAKRLCMA
jgi:hypothetical protein